MINKPSPTQEILKPCPLCEGVPFDRGYGVVCLNCGLWLGDGTQTSGKGGYRTVWNDRKPEIQDVLNE